MTSVEKAELWDYYQEFVRGHGAKSITDLVVQRGNLKAQNEALLAQVEKLPCECRPHDYTTGEPYTCDRCKILSGVNAQQSLDSLKARIEEETIDRCAKAAINCADYDYPRKEFSDSIKRIQRKYKSSSKTDK